MPGRRRHRVQEAASPTQLATMANVEDSLTLTSLVQELDKHRASLAAELKNNLSKSLETSLMPIQASLETISTVLDSHKQKITAIEDTLTAHSAELAELTTRVGQLEKANAVLVNKTEDLENRCRRQNLRTVGLPEGLEGGSPVEFISRLLQPVVGKDTFPEPSELDRAHRTLAPKPAAGQRPRAVLVRFLRYQDKERVLRWARLQKDDIKFNSNKILFFPDMSASLAKQRATFKDIKAKLYAAGITFSLHYPARLCITVNGNKHLFDSPAAAEGFYEKNYATRGEEQDELMPTS